MAFCFIFGRADCQVWLEFVVVQKINKVLKELRHRFFQKTLAHRHLVEIIDSEALSGMESVALIFYWYVINELGRWGVKIFISMQVKDETER